MSKEAIKMTKEQVVEMEEALMLSYKKAEFQNALHEAYKAARGDTMEFMKRRQELTLPIQIPAITKYGFEGTKKGVAQATAAVQSTPDQTEEMQRNHLVLMWLVDPEDQKARPDFVPDAEIPDDIRPPKEKIYAEELVHKGTEWVVVGGQGKGGVVVRKGKELSSPFFKFRLATGARVLAESEVTSNRLHYRKVTGDGPDFGWVSITNTNNKLLVKPVIEMDENCLSEFAKLTYEAEEIPPVLFSPPEKPLVGGLLVD